MRLRGIITALTIEAIVLALLLATSGCAYLGNIPWPDPVTDPPDPPPVVEPIPDPIPATITRAPWLRDPATINTVAGHKEWCSFEWMRFPDAVRREWVTYIRARGGNSVFVTLSHTSAGITPYRSGFSGEFSPEKLKAYRDAVSFLNGNGITPMLSLFDDTPPFHNDANEAEHRRYVTRMVSNMAGLQVRWCTAMEPEEFWTSAYGDKVAKMLKSAGVKQVYVHSQTEAFLTGNVAGLLHERNHPREGRGVSPATLQALYTGMVQRHPDREIWAWEWTWFQDDAAAQTAACLAAGCKGVGQ